MPVEFNLPSHEIFVQMMKSNPATIDTRNILGLDEKTYEDFVVQILKEKYPEVPAKMMQTALVGYGSKWLTCKF